jgi:hypothetical protein
MMIGATGMASIKEAPDGHASDGDAPDFKQLNDFLLEALGEGNVS